MDIKLASGRYLIAVSGGVDSMVLLDILRRQAGIELVVAHFDHGIRSDSQKDEKLVRTVATKYNLLFELGRTKLGPKASEEQARNTRYTFLDSLKSKHKADAIITAHHQDDLIETAILNILRGSGRRGLSAIRDNPAVIRPFLDIPKKKILQYALKHKIIWHEDETNQDINYLRNYIRAQVLPKLTNQNRQQLLQNIDKVAKNSQELNDLIATLSQKIVKDNKVNRRLFLSLPPEVSHELLMYWLRQLNIRQFSRQNIERLNIAIRTSKARTKTSALEGKHLIIEKDIVYFDNP